MFSNRALDQASEIEQADRDQAVERVRARLSTGASAEHCQDDSCGDPIPEARRLAIAGCKFCVACQQRREKAR